MTMTPEDVTMVRGAVHNPAEPRHFMRIVPAGKAQVASVAGTVIADSESALVVKEVARDIYDPVVYFPRADINMAALAKIEKTTHCPLKGDTEYFDIVVEGGVVEGGVVDGGPLEEAAWSYTEMIVGGDELANLIAFDTRKVDVGPRTD
ncbi:MAG: DUF427 domain-containing protein [Acidimicrobiales bacterium]